MSALIGREREVATALGMLTTVRETPVARSLIVEGPAGVGKTSVLSAVLEQAPEWTVARTAAHRIQASLPLAVVRRLTKALTDALGDQAERYTAGLGDIETSNPTLTLLRLAEGVALDHPLLVAIDDVQWIDEESADALGSLLAALADRPIALLMSERTEGAERSARVEPDSRITLGPLSKAAALAAARAEYPEANDEVLASIVAHSGGHPIDLVALARSAHERGAGSGDEVADSLRAVTVKNVQSLPARLREFLQVISLLNEPIDYSLLRRMWPDDNLLVKLIADASERFIVQEGTNLRFSHGLLADAVLETVPVKIPMRRRIIAALNETTSPSIEDRLQIAEQAQACGDRDLAIETLTKLALDAIERGQVRLTINVAEQLRTIGEPTDAFFVPFYLGYGRALHFIDRADLVMDVLQHALDEGSRRGLGGMAPIAAQFVLAQWFSDQNERALSNYERYSSRFTSPADRLALNSAALWFAACDADLARLDDVEAQLIAPGMPAVPEVALRVQIARAYATMRLGEFQRSREAIAKVEEIARTVPSALRNLAEFARSFVDVCILGVGEAKLEDLRKHYTDEEGGSWIDYFYSSTEIFAGRYHNAAVIVDDALGRYSDPIHRRRMLTLASALSALTGQQSTFHRAIESDITRLLTGERGVWFMPLASWGTLLPDVSDARARLLSRIVLAHLARPSDPLVITFATPIVVSAIERGDGDLLHDVVQDGAIWDDRRPILSADVALARALARGERAGKPDGGLDEALEQCRSLGLTALETMAARLLKKARAPKTETRSPLTARERQIAHQVAQGLSNRQIAEALVLSERTVEGHIANIFNKLNVSSRTQVAAWVLSATTAS